jgi:hypothetical protein
MRTYFLALLPIAFLLHLGWEYAQCQPFFTHGQSPPTAAAMLMAAAGDLVLTAMAYAGVAAATRRWDWALQRWSRPVWVSLLVLATALSVAVEMYALATGRWAYTTLAPIVPIIGVSLIPVLQLVLLLPLSFALARAVTLRRDLSP